MKERQTLRRSLDTDMRSAQSCDCVIPLAGARFREANHWNVEGEYWAQWARVMRWSEKNTLIERQSWGPSNDSGLRMVNWESQSQNTPESGRRKHLLYFTSSYCILWRVSKLATSLLVYVTMNIYFCFYFDTTLDVVTVLFIFVDIYHLYYTFSHPHTEAHTHKHTCMISTLEQWRQPRTGAWLGGSEERLLLETEA